MQHQRPSESPRLWRQLVAPSLVTLIALAILLGLGFWQLQRLAWKEGLIAQIQSRAYGPPGEIQPEENWSRWQPESDEFRHVALFGRFLHEREAFVHGLLTTTPGMPVQGFFLFTPLELDQGGQVLVNRGFVPSDRAPIDRPPSATVTGLVRAPEQRGFFTPEDVPTQNHFFARDPVAIATAKKLDRAAPFYVEADANPSSEAWPRSGTASLTLPNNHFQYALTWFGIALTLVGVFSVFAYRHLRKLP